AGSCCWRGSHCCRSSRPCRSVHKRGTCLVPSFRCRAIPDCRTISERRAGSIRRPLGQVDVPIVPFGHPVRRKLAVAARNRPPYPYIRRIWPPSSAHSGGNVRDTPTRRKVPMGRTLASCLVLATLAGIAPAAASQQQSFSADYSVTLLGLPIAKARFDSTFTTDSFTIDGSLTSSGIARIFDKTTGTTRVEGSIGRDGAFPRTFRSHYDSGRKKSRTTIRFARGTVSSVENTPEPRRGETWVPVAEDHLRAALDPLTSTLIR